MIFAHLLHLVDKKTVLADNEYSYLSPQPQPHKMLYTVKEFLLEKC